MQGSFNSGNKNPRRSGDSSITGETPQDPIMDPGAVKTANTMRTVAMPYLCARIRARHDDILLGLRRLSGGNRRGNIGADQVLPQPGKALERPSSTRLEARFPYHGSGAMGLPK